MNTLGSLFESNRIWAERVRNEQPDLFKQLTAKQSPEYLWIGCSDSRVPPCVILDVPPGGVFVHRNIGNIVGVTDINGLSVIQYAVECLKVKHIIVCGHYGCGAVNAALFSDTQGSIDAWLEYIRAIHRSHRAELDAIESPECRANRLSEINVAEQVSNVCNTGAVSRAWDAGQELHIHGWIYHLDDGLLTDLEVSRSGPVNE